MIFCRGEFRFNMTCQSLSNVERKETDGEKNQEEEELREYTDRGSRDQPRKKRPPTSCMYESKVLDPTPGVWGKLSERLRAGGRPKPERSYRLNPGDEDAIWIKW